MNASKSFFGYNEFVLSSWRNNRSAGRRLTRSCFNRLARIEPQSPKLSRTLCSNYQLLRSVTTDVEFWVLPHGVRFASLDRGEQKNHASIFRINITRRPRAVREYVESVVFLGVDRCAPLSPDFLREQVREFVQSYIDRSQSFSFCQVAM